MRPLLLALDIGNVCVRINHFNLAAALGLPAVPEPLRQAALEYECGRMTEAEFFRTAHEISDKKYSIGQLTDAFDSILIEPVPGMEKLVSMFPELNVKAVFFSDISPTHLRRTREIFQAAQVVPDGVYSFEAGNLKPSIEMFSNFEKRFGVPDLYVDDRRELIEAARKRNWHALQFTGAGELSDELKKLLSNN